jgi:RNA polymerase sigma-70 factor (ECF subfamily)
MATETHEVRFAELYDRCRGPITDYCARRVANDLVDDAVAETLLTTWRRIDEVPAGEEALLWMYGVARRVIGHQWRSAGRQRRLAERLQSIRRRSTLAADGAVIDDDEDCAAVLAALARVGETDAEVLRLVVWEELSIGDVATVLGIEPNAVRQRLYRARRHLMREHERMRSGSAPATRAAQPGGAQ